MRTYLVEGQFNALSVAEALRRRSWARLLRKVFEVDPLVCPRCGETMVVVATITDWVIVDRIVRHVRERALRSVHEEASARDPPGLASGPTTSARRSGERGRAGRDRPSDATERPRATQDAPGRRGSLDRRA